MPVHNSDIAGIFGQLADVLEIQGANQFRVRAYRNAARAIGNWPKDLALLVKEKDELPKIPGVGKDLAEKIREIAKTGHLEVFERLQKKTPAGLLGLLRLPGLGPKRVHLLQKKLGIRSLDDLGKEIRAGRLQKLRGFGEKTEKKLLDALVGGAAKPTRVLLAVAEQTADSLLDYLRETKVVKEAIVAGSYRRRLETVGDLDILVTTAKAPTVMERFLAYEDIREVLSHGPTRATVVLNSGMQVDLRVVSEESYGSALHYFTGSKAHNIAIRTMGLRRKLKINEYGIFRGGKRVGGRTEEEVFQSVGLPYIEPELRENRGEIAAAEKGRLPRLVTVQNIRGDLHAHTRETDGHLSLEEMAEAAKSLGYEYLAITDHSQRLTVARGLSPARVREQVRRIDQFNERERGFRLLKSIEVDILEDGTLDLPNEVLALLDFTVCSVHSKFDLSADKQTERILRAMDNPNFHVLGHPSGRLLGTRDPYAVDMERIVRAAKERGCFLEVNAQPERMDLSDTYCRMAKELGVKLAISTDAHSAQDLQYMKYGVGQARRGWLEANDVLNTRSWKELQKLLRRK